MIGAGISGLSAAHELVKKNKKIALFARPFKHVYFSGEHVGVQQGYMKGAAQSGYERARDIILALNK